MLPLTGMKARVEQGGLALEPGTPGQLEIENRLPIEALVVVEGGGFSQFRRATETPFNLVFEARP